jgi:hypothetical protein
MRRFLIRSLILASIFFVFNSWGFLVHRTVHQLAVYRLPKQMQPFFFKNIDYLVEHAPRADQRRNQDSNEAPKHFVDLEAFYDWSEQSPYPLPLRWEDAVKKYSRDTLVKYGYVPYHIITMKNLLTEAFRSRNRDSILFYATDIGHYIGDANVPLHTTLNYDGQLTNQKGLHSLWESVAPEIEIEHYKLYSRHDAAYLSDPAQSVKECLMQSFSLVKDVLAKETEVSKGFTDSTKYRWQTRRGREVRYYTSAFAKAYNKALGNTINRQLLRSSEMIADFWYTAWVDAGRPDLSGLLRQPFSKHDKKLLKTEKAAWKKEELQGKKMLLAKKQAGSD